MTALADDWRLAANCATADPDLFTPDDKASAASYAKARAVCSGCWVRRECLTYAITNGEQHGMWGGMTPAERQELVASIPNQPDVRCVKGHNITKVGRTVHGQCRQCRRDAEARMAATRRLLRQQAEGAA